MKSLAAVFCLLFSSVTVFAINSSDYGIERYRVSFEADSSSGLNGQTKDAYIVITGPGIRDPKTNRPMSENSHAISVPFHGFTEIKFENLKTFIDPYALAAMIEEGLNSKKVNINEVTEFLSNHDWLTTSNSSSLVKKLRAPTRYKAVFQADVTSGLSGETKEANIVITGPGIVDPKTQRPSSEVSDSISIPFHGLNETKFENLKTFIDPWALAAMIEEGLNNKRVNIKKVTEFLSNHDWLTTSNSSSLVKKLRAPTRFKAVFQTDVTSGLSGETKEANIVITGPGIVDPKTQRPSSESSHSISVPFHGFTETKFKSISSFVDPETFAAMIESGLNNGSVELKEVLEYLSNSDWHTLFYPNSKIRKSLKKTLPAKCHLNFAN